MSVLNSRGKTNYVGSGFSNRIDAAGVLDGVLAALGSRGEGEEAGDAEVEVLVGNVPGFERNLFNLGYTKEIIMSAGKEKVTVDLPHLYKKD